MSFIGDQKQHFIQALTELASEQEQVRLWLSDGTNGEVSSFFEALETLYTDINLEPIILAGELGAPEKMTVLFDELQNSVNRAAKILTDQERIKSPLMKPVRALAGDILNTLPEDFFPAKRTL